MSGMKDNIMKNMEAFAKEKDDPEEDLEVMRWYIRRADYGSAGELMEAFEYRYHTIMKTMGMEDIQCRFWQLKLEIMTQGFSLMEISREEEQIITDMYRMLVRMDHVSVRAIRYLFHREEYLRTQKKLNYIEAENSLKKASILGMVLMLSIACVLSWIRVELGGIDSLTVNGILWASIVVYFMVLCMFASFCKKAQSQWYDFVMNPLPFEHSALF